MKLLEQNEWYSLQKIIKFQFLPLKDKIEAGADLVWSNTSLLNTWEKAWQVESFEHMEHYDMNFVEKLLHLKRRGR